MVFCRSSDVPYKYDSSLLLCIVMVECLTVYLSLHVGFHPQAELVQLLWVFCKPLRAGASRRNLACNVVVRYYFLYRVKGKLDTQVSA